MNNLKNKVTEAAASKVKDATEGFLNFPQIDSNVTVWFIFEGKEYEVAQFSINFAQGVDHKGQPQDEIRGGIINVLLTEVVPDNIYKWAMKSNLSSGCIEFRSKTSNSPLKIQFMDASCVNMERVIEVSGGINTVLVISPGELKINDLDMSNNWV